MDLSAFKAYDIRGRVPDQLNEDILERIGRGLATLIDRFTLLNNAVVTSSDQNLLSIMHRIAPQVRRGFVAERFTRDPLEVCLNHHCSHLVINHHRCTPGMIDAAHDLGLKVSTWTVNEVTFSTKTIIDKIFSLPF